MCNSTFNSTSYQGIYASELEMLHFVQQLTLSVGVLNIFAENSYLLPLETMLLRAARANKKGKGACCKAKTSWII